MFLKKIPFKKALSEPVLFYLLVILNAIPILKFDFFLTIDGPAHLYNANTIKSLFFGESQLLKDFYSLNYFFIPNWTGHFLMAFFRIFFEAHFSEKLLQLLYVILLPVSFRFLIKSFQQHYSQSYFKINSLLTILIFPFTYSILFICGFYNFQLSFIFLFFTLGIWIKKYSEPNLKNLLLLALLLILVYYSHILIFMFTVALGLFFVLVREFYLEQTLGKYIKKVLRKGLFFFLAALPGLILMLLFFLNVRFAESNDERLSFSMLLKWIYHVRPLIFFNYEAESLITKYYFFVYLFIIALIVFFRAKWGIKAIRNKYFSHKNILNPIDFLLLPFVIVTLFLYFYIPTGASAGMMSERLCILFFTFLIIWLAIQPFPKWLNLSLIAVLIFINFQLWKIRFPQHKALSDIVHDVRKAAEKIEDETIVYPIDFSSNWVLGHTLDYLGANKKIVLIDNYEPFKKWFPLVWDKYHCHKVFAGNSLRREMCPADPSVPISVSKIDYIVVMGNYAELEQEQYAELRNNINEFYERCYVSESGFISVLKRK